jgi:hypothetical protein
VRRAGAALLLGLAAAGAGCVTDPWGDPLPGHDARVVLLPGGEPARAAWPVSFRRGARFVVENATGRPVETILLDFGGKGEPRELVEAVIEDPPGKPAAILDAPHGLFPLRALLGDPGSVLLAPGGSLVLRVRVDGTPGRSTAVFTIPL